MVPKGPGANSNLAAMSGNDNVTVKPLVKHVLSKELQMYFEKVCSAILDESNNEYRIAALASIRSDPGLHQLVPYFVQFIAEKVTHNLKTLFVLTQVMQLMTAMLENKNLYLDPYVCLLSQYRCNFCGWLIYSVDRFSDSASIDLPDWKTLGHFSRSTRILSITPSRRICDFVYHQKVQQVVIYAKAASRSHLPEKLSRS